MKYRFWILVITLLFLLSLSGCECKHEWSEADCLNPQSCQKCAQIGEPPLGHNWVAATCSTPETCTRCGITRGENLRHSYSEWDFDEDQMSRSCSICGVTDTKKIDREQYLESLITGRWDLWSIELESGVLCGSHVYTESPKPLVCSIMIQEDRSFQLQLPLDTGAYIGTGVYWSFSEYIQNGDTEEYHFWFHTTEPRRETLEAYLSVEPDGNHKLHFSGANFGMTFYQVPEEILAGVCSNWIVTSIYADKSYCFQILPDGTASCYIEGVFEGNWYIGGDSEDPNSVGILIPYVRNETDEIFQALIQLDGADISVPSLYLRNRGSSMEFQQANDEELAIVQNATDMLAGTWTSIGFGSRNRENADLITSDYSITIQKNNKFTLTVPDGQIYSGSWAASACADHRYQYYLYFPEHQKTVACTLDARFDGTYLWINERGTDENTLYFKQMSEIELAGMTLPVGTWISTYERSNDESVCTDKYRLSFYEDGTFAAQLKEETQGIWKYLRYEESIRESGEDTQYTVDEWGYHLTFDGETDPVLIQIERYKEDETLRVYLTVTDTEGNKTTYGFVKE